MRSRLARTAAIAMMAIAGVTEVWATCGGGGGGGTGGMSGGSASNPEVYPVPWKVVQAAEAGDPFGLAIYWFPASQNEIDKSSLRNSRVLSLYAAQCVALGLSDSRSALGQKYAGGETLPVAVLTKADGTVIGRAQQKDGRLNVTQIEKLVETEVKQQENGLKETMKAAKELAKTDKDGAIAKYRDVESRKCLLPKLAKDASNELKKLGAGGRVVDVPLPVFDPVKSAAIEATIRRGLVAENASKYEEAGRVYDQARRMDPADPAPLRYLGELYRHHIGDWDKARGIFNRVLTMRADPLSRAVALHGLGKMTIHDGEFDKGRDLMEQSVKAFPIALAYRNLAVYWNSEGDKAKADSYTRLAYDLDPSDPFNLIFSAAFMADTRPEEALKIARAHEGELSASYNLAAVYAQIGQKEKALALLKRHFFEYERYQAVRAKEMMEARVDAVFESIVHTPEFMALTKDADGKLPMPMRKK